MIPARPAQSLAAALSAAVAAGDLRQPAETEIQVRADRRAGLDMVSTPLALRVAAATDLTAQRSASVLAHRLQIRPEVAEVTVRADGWLSFRLHPLDPVAVVRDVLSEDWTATGSSGLRVELSVVGALDGHPLPLIAGRELLLADFLARIHRACGADVLRRVGPGTTPVLSALRIMAGPAGDASTAGPAPDLAAAQTGAARACLTIDGRREPIAAGPVVEVGGASADDLLALVAASGIDAVRYCLLREPAAATIRFDPDRWAGEDERNPVYLVQYAHARSLATIRADAAGPIPTEVARPVTDLLADHRQVVAQATGRAPERLTDHLEELAVAVHRMLDFRGLEPREDGVPGAALCRAAARVLADGLGLLGVTAPEQM